MTWGTVHNSRWNSSSKSILQSLALRSTTVILHCQNRTFTDWYPSPCIGIRIKIQSEMISAFEQKSAQMKTWGTVSPPQTGVSVRSKWLLNMWAHLFSFMLAGRAKHLVHFTITCMPLQESYNELLRSYNYISSIRFIYFTDVFCFLSSCFRSRLTTLKILNRDFNIISPRRSPPEHIIMTLVMNQLAKNLTGTNKLNTIQKRIVL